MNNQKIIETLNRDAENNQPSVSNPHLAHVPVGDLRLYADMQKIYTELCEKGVRFHLSFFLPGVREFRGFYNAGKLNDESDLPALQEVSLKMADALSNSVSFILNRMCYGPRVKS